MYQRAKFSGVRQYTGEQLLLKSFFDIANHKRANDLALPLLCDFKDGTKL
jgi:hypothetical protein